MAVLLIRHGETALNAARVLQWPDTPLSARGQAQAACLATRLSSAPIARILVSDYRRAVDTAAPLAACRGLSPEVLEVLRERNYGELRGQTYAALGLDPHAHDYEPPGGESWAVFHARAAQAWDAVQRLAAVTAGDVAVVTHGLVCRSLCERVIGYPADLDPAGVVFHNTSVTTVVGAPWRLQTVCCARHLDPALLAGGAPA